MKHRLMMIAIAVAFFVAAAITASAQTVTYLDADYKPATATNYMYKRVIKYKEPILNPNIGTGYYGNITANVQLTGLHVCSLIDYYNTGEPALVVNVVTIDLKCSQWAFDGMAISYFKDGTVKQKAPYRIGKLFGTVITYDQSGNETERQDYENGKLIDADRFVVPADSPLVGTWKFVEYYPSLFGGPSKTVKTAITAVFSSNGILEISVQGGLLNSKEKTNWKYIPKNSNSGILEQYQGDELQYRGNVRWVNNNQFEYTNTFNQNPNMVGTQYLYTKQ
ncbi:MAG TPA: hypothetical protein VE863_11885 [Pyrinomonadaceae bacterium]|nr:hypothetical protein [Pyrinomonadaceae bacterium]